MAAPVDHCPTCKQAVLKRTPYLTGLTWRQRRLVESVEEFKVKMRRDPTLKEIALMIGVKSASSALGMMRRAERNGLVSRSANAEGNHAAAA